MKLKYSIKESNSYKIAINNSFIIVLKCKLNYLNNIF